MNVFSRPAVLGLLTVALGWGSLSASAATYYVDFDNGNDANNGTSQATAWRTLPGTKAIGGSAWLRQTWGGAFNGVQTRVPIGTTFKLKSGTTMSSADGGCIWIDETYYADGATTYAGGFNIERDTTWGSGNITIDGSGVTAGIAMVIIKVNGVKIDGKTPGGIRIVNSPYNGLQVKEKPNSAAVQWTWLENLYFHNSGGSLVSDTAGAGYGQINIRRAYHVFIRGIELSGDNKFINGILQGDNYKEVTDSYVTDCLAYDHRGDLVTDDSGIGFKAFNGQITFTNVVSHHNLKGFDLGEQSGQGAPITYKVINCTSFLNNWGVNYNAARDASYVGPVNFYLINSLIYSNYFFGCNTYSSPYNFHAVHNTFAYNGSEPHSGDYSGHLRVTPDASNDNGVIRARVYNNIFYKPWDCQITTAWFSTTGGTDYSLDADYNIYVQRASELFCQWAYFHSGQAWNVGYTPDGPAILNGKWYTQPGRTTTAPPTAGIGHQNSDRNSVVMLSSDSRIAGLYASGTGTNFLATAEYRGTPLSSKPWYISEMGYDRSGQPRSRWSMGPRDAVVAVPLPVTGVSVSGITPSN